MHIVVCSSLPAGSQKANAINVVKMAQGFARLGHIVTLICKRPFAKRVPKAKLAKIYGITAPIRWVQLPGGRLLGDHRRFGWLVLQMVKRLQPDMVYARNYYAPIQTSHFGVPTVGESHAHIGNNRRPFRAFLQASKHQNFRGLVTISQRLADHYIERGAPSHKLMVLEDAVDLQLFLRPANVPPSPYQVAGSNVVYTGHLYDYKGIPTVIEAARFLPHVNFHLVGGLPNDIQRQKHLVAKLELKNVTFYGLLPQPALPPFLWHADLLLLPPSQHHASAMWTSPVKLGEYLASGTPLLATDIVALRDWLSDDEAYFVTPDDPSAMSAGIELVLADKNLQNKLSQHGLKKAQEMSYRNRAARIVEKAFSAEPSPIEKQSLAG